MLKETEQFNFFYDYWAEAKSGNDSWQNAREYGEKCFCHASRFWLLREWRVLVNPLKKKNLWQKCYFRQY